MEEFPKKFYLFDNQENKIKRMDSTFSTVPTVAADFDDVTVAVSNLFHSTQVATKPNSLVLKLEFRSPTKETPSIYANQAKTVIMKITEDFPNEVTVFDNQEKEIQRIDAALSNDKFNRIFNLHVEQGEQDQAHGFHFSTNKFNRIFNLHVRKASPKAQKKQQCHFYQFHITTTTTLF
jgi:hypothetical protein